MDVLNEVWRNITEFFANIRLYITIDLMLVVAGALLLIVIILAIVLTSSGRKYGRMLEQKLENDDTLLKNLNERESRVAKKEQALLRREAELEKGEKEFSGAQKTEQPSPYSRGGDMAFFDLEHRRLIAEARRQAHDILLQADREYLEIISLAHEEAEFLRNRASSRISDARETLKASLKRTNAIIGDADVEVIEEAPAPLPAEPEIEEETAAATSGDE